MFESFEFETLTAPQAAIWLGLALGVAFGALAQITRFCLRRGLVGAAGERRSALAVWLLALAAATLGTQGAVGAGWIGFEDHRFHAAELPLAAVLLGGGLFGAGMVLTRGCVSRLTVLGAGGNLRALSVLLVFAVTAHATLKGLLAPARSVLGEMSLTAPTSLPGQPMIWAALLALGALALALRARIRPTHAALALLIGLLVPAGWVGTGLVLYDDFDPVPLQSLSFTGPYADSLFWTIASSAVPANFGTGLVGGTLLGALALTLLRGQFRWQSFDSPAQTGRYVLGAALMGTGGALAGGCTIGAGFAGVPTLGLSALLTLVAIAGGALAMDRVLQARPQPQAIPAE